MNEKLWEDYVNNKLNSGITKRRIQKLRMIYTIIQRAFNKRNLEELTRPDIEKFIFALNKDEFKNIKGKPYSGSTKSDIKKFIKQFWKWLKGEDEFYPKEVSWIKTKIAKDERPIEKEILSIEEVKKLADSFVRIQYKIITLLLFDSGFRIQEMLSVTKKDLTFEEYEGKEKCFWIKCNISKTIPRKVPIPLFTEEINQFMNSSYYETLKSNEHLYRMTYSAVLHALSKNAVKHLHKKISPHNLRHSSATYYSMAYDGNMNMIADRYGWEYNSNELKLYIRRSGAYQKVAVKKVFDNQVVKLKEENRELKERMEDLEMKQANIKNEVIASLKKQFLELRHDSEDTIEKFIEIHKAERKTKSNQDETQIKRKNIV